MGSQYAVPAADWGGFNSRRKSEAIADRGNEIFCGRFSPSSVAWNRIMRKSNWTPSIVPPRGDDQNVYIVLDDFGRNGRTYRETDVERVHLEAVIMDMLEGQYQNPVRVVGFNTTER